MADHACTTRRALFGGALALMASANATGPAKAAPSTLTAWERADAVAQAYGDPTVLRLMEVAKRAGWSPGMLCAFAEEEVLGIQSWASTQARHHPRHADWPAVIKHAERAGYEAGEVEAVVAVFKGPRAGRLVCMLECGREITAAGVL